MPPWPQQGPTAPAVTRPTGLETWLGQHHLASGGAGGPALAPGPGVSAQAPPTGTSSRVSDSRVEGQAAALQHSLVGSYSPRWPPPPLPTVPRRETSHAVGNGAPRTHPFSTTAIPVPQIPLMHRPNSTERWPPHRPQPQVHTAGTPYVAATPQTSMPMAGGAPADTGADKEDDEEDVVPLVVSDLDPLYHRQLGISAERKEENEQKERPKPQVQIQVPVKQQRKEQASGLAGLSMQSARGPTAQKAAQKPERNGAAKDQTSHRTATAVPAPAFTPKRTKATAKTANVTTPGGKRASHETTPTHSTPLSSFSIIIPAATPRASDGDSGPRAATASAVPAGKAATAGAEKKPPGSSPVVAVGRRSKAVSSIVQIKGRPKGWKPGMSYREVALRNAGIEGEEAAAYLFPPPRRRRRRRAGGGDGDDDDDDDLRRKNEKRRRAARSDGDRRRPNYVLAKRSGRPPAPSTEAIQRAIFRNSPAVFMPFVCEWAGCRAELQNMATLRRHVMVVHGRTATTCQWRRCASREPLVSFLGSADADAKTAAPGADAENDANPASTRIEVFRAHMEYQHLAPVEWHQGDGFVNNSHLGPRQPPLSLSTLSIKSKARERAATAAADAAAAAATGGPIPPPLEPGQVAANTDGRGGDGSGTVLPAEGAAAALEADADADATAAAAASTAFASYNVPTEDLPRYLLDEQGKQVTPLLRDPLLELSTAFPTPEERMRQLRELYRYRYGSRYPMGDSLRPS